MSAQGTGTQPPVGVVIATRDRFGLLARALEAVWTQSYAGEVNVAVVIDGEVPDHLELPEPPEPDRQTLTVHLNQREPGQCGARNTGMEALTEDYLALCDDDDVWTPDRLALGVAELEAHPESVAVGGSIRIVRGDTVTLRRAPFAEVGLDELLADRIMELHSSAMLFRREPLEKVDGWDASLPGGYAEDYDQLLKLARLGTIRLVPEVVADIEWNGGSFFFSRWRMIADALTEMLRRYPEFERQRAGRARIEAQIAFAHAALGERAEARRWLRAARADNRREPRIALTLLVLSRVVSADRLQRALHARGRGI
ncbi:glycosyltransferase family A protein [uncultured Nocardioides sp.]|uniref:glycosyltransferase family 2 protein n=1 Tax=uncultured Nocardioides sp. TaxID=198441 RepID=UPI002605E029|nr:glycosyltransferase family A protein [uncultured Nocardioides sp.]